MRIATQRNRPVPLQSQPRDPFAPPKASSHMANFTATARDRVHRWSAMATSKVQELRRPVLVKVRDLNHKSKIQAQRARATVNRVRQERPFTVVFVAAAAGLLL